MRPSFSSYYQLPEALAVKALHENLTWSAAEEHSAGKKAKELIEQIRAQKRPAGQLESFLQEYSLSTEEGLALMSLAEALLRIPDKSTANALIRDKVAAANWMERRGTAKDWVVKAAGFGLFMSSKTLDGLFARVGEPFVREAMVGAMQVLGKQFVLGRDIEEAVQNSRKYTAKGYRISYDRLGEGARTAIDAQNYFESYAQAIAYIGERAKSETLRPGISVKLSALYPRYSVLQEERCVPVMSAQLHELCELAMRHRISLTVDAEESERLDVSVKIIESILCDPKFREWEGFGLAVQAYHKATLPLIDHIVDRARAGGKRIQMRLVKGAYWDSEIKKSQVNGFDDFPVYTRKCHTDTSYLVCAGRMFAAGDILYPMLATHNALSAAQILELSKSWNTPFEFQRLFGMGQGLHDLILQHQQVGVSIYAPVGPHEDLLPYLVRRLLENGANSSFVNQVLNPDASVDELVVSPVDKSRIENESKHPRIILPKDLFLNEKPMGRLNSRGLDLYAAEVRAELKSATESFVKNLEAASLINGVVQHGGFMHSVVNPAKTAKVVGHAVHAGRGPVDKAFESAMSGFGTWNEAEPEIRACALDRAADLLEARQKDFMTLLVREAGKTWSDALNEVREAVDFLRYYAAQGRGVFAPEIMAGPTGEKNQLSLHGRGVFVCISPWNFPLAIFTGQIAAALMAGNAVIAKPAEQTPLIAMRMIQLLHEAGVHKAALHLIIGDGTIGEALVQHRAVAGVAFTGSTEVARIINRVLATKDGPIVPLIAETGGQNVMLVDSSALPEQVVDDAILSAFGSAGQRCSALRVLCLQDDCADKIIRLLKGAMAELYVGDPAAFSTDIGPVIDEEARSKLTRHRAALNGFGKLIAQVDVTPAQEQSGFFFAPCAYEITTIKALKGEVFGPILHVLRFKRDALEDLMDEIQETGYGLTLGIHSRISSFQERIVAKMKVGNIYVNRSMIGAVVGSQPFGGMGLSGTGPKAGGPHYLARFATEKAICINTTAAGGNASLVSLTE
jgi:RHH-type proline utilization regulon transcriptional repressor/proline dehydrogenase/delta 1-pyrroline-5-carboxylate dehydrogenase